MHTMFYHLLAFMVVHFGGGRVSQGFQRLFQPTVFLPFASVGLGRVELSSACARGRYQGGSPSAPCVLFLPKVQHRLSAFLPFLVPFLSSHGSVAI